MISDMFLGWRKHKLESRLPGEISITSDMQMTPPLHKICAHGNKICRGAVRVPSTSKRQSAGPGAAMTLVSTRT